MTKHGEIAEHLAEVKTPAVSLTFDEIETILGYPLPQSAYDHNAWWSNPTDNSHPWARAWVIAGWKTERVKPQERMIHFRRERPTEYHAIDSLEAIEGYRRDRSIFQRSRNARLAEKRREMDDYTCIACGFRLSVDSSFVIEVHHLNPLSETETTITTLDDLVSLCPTCHRISHLRSPLPYSVASIRAFRDSANGE